MRAGAAAWSGADFKVRRGEGATFPRGLMVAGARLVDRFDGSGQ
jgi:hypothetical protein